MPFNVLNVHSLYSQQQQCSKKVVDLVSIKWFQVSMVLRYHVVNNIICQHSDPSKTWIVYFAGSVIFGSNKLRLMTRLQKNVSVFQGGQMTPPPCPCLWAPIGLQKSELVCDLFASCVFVFTNCKCYKVSAKLMYLV